MLQTIEAIVDEHGHICLLESFPLPSGQRVLVTVLEKEAVVRVPDVTLLSEAALAEDWARPEEDEAWSHLQ